MKTHKKESCKYVGFPGRGVFAGRVGTTTKAVNPRSLYHMKRQYQSVRRCRR
jgi:hypothetical protein